MMKFDGKVLLIGYGSVARCTLPILLKHVEIPYGNITIIDFENKASALKEWTSKGVGYRQQRITPDNIDSVLSRDLSPGGLLIDLAWNLDTCTFIRWCHEHEVLFVNTSLEVWDSMSEIDPRTRSRSRSTTADAAEGTDQGLDGRGDRGHRPRCESRSEIPFREAGSGGHTRAVDGRTEGSGKEAERFKALLRAQNCRAVHGPTVKVIHCPEGRP